MHYTVPHYYRKFHCLAGFCPATCCAGWQIQIDPKTLRRYVLTKGPLGSRLKNEINWKEKRFRQYNGRCAFLNENNLCDLYLEGSGDQAFCRTCRTYPRHIEEFEGLREISLSLSCPAAAKLILGCREPVRFLHAENPRRKDHYQNFDFLLFTKLMDTRDLAIKMLQDRSHPFRVRAAAVLSLSHDLQERIDRGALFDTDSLLERYSSPRVWTWFEGRLDFLARGEAGKKHSSVRDMTLGSLFVILNQMEVLQPDWKTYLRKSRSVLSDRALLSDTDSGERRNEADSQAADTFREIFPDTAAEQLMIYFIFTYFCGAVYNQNAYGKMKFSFACTILIRELTRAGWISENCGELSRDNPDFPSDILLRSAYRFAREVEHSDFNKYKLEKMLDNEEKFGLEKLFSLLL